MRIEVVYAEPAEQVVLALELPSGCTVEAAVRQSGVLDRFPSIELGRNKVGIFGKLCDLTQLLKDGDRVEIYRPLIADPKDARRSRAAKTG